MKSPKLTPIKVAVMNNTVLILSLHSITKISHRHCTNIIIQSVPCVYLLSYLEAKGFRRKLHLDGYYFEMSIYLRRNMG